VTSPLITIVPITGSTPTTLTLGVLDFGYRHDLQGRGAWRAQERRDDPRVFLE
jgi:hypothetical protein